MAGVPLILLAAAFAVGVALPLEEYALAPADKRPIVIDDVSIVDLETGAVPSSQSILIMDGRIVYAGPAASAPVPPSARRISGAGKFAIPGLWDMHVHTVRLSPQLHFPLMIANGVTSMRNMGDGCSFGGDTACRPDAAHWAARAGAGPMLAPRNLASASYHVEDVEDGIVATLKQRGDRMLKLQLDNDVSPAVFNSLVRQGRAGGMLVAGHLPHSVDLLAPGTEMLNSIEHDTGLLPQCSAQLALFDGRTHSKMAVLRRADPQRCAAVLALMVEHGVGYVPSHVASSGQDAFLLTDAYQRDPHLRYVAWTQRALWRLFAVVSAAGTSDDDRAPLLAWHQAALGLTAQAHASGVAVMAGSDAIDAYVTHGVSLHDELAQFVRAGLTPLDALRAATVVPAKHAGLEADFGAIASGKVADIVLLNKNPLLDIAHAREIDSVLVDGRLHERKQLDAMLAFVAGQASSFSLNCKFLWGLIGP